MQIFNYVFQFFKEYGEGIIAVCALSLTVWQFVVQRKHNRVSVRPHITRATDTSWNNGDASLKVSITNNGLGPAIIKDFKVFYKNAECEPEIAIKEALGELQKNCQFGTMGEDSALAQGESKVLLNVRFKTQHPSQIELVRAKIDTMDFYISYKSAYGETWEIDTRDHG